MTIVQTSKWYTSVTYIIMCYKNYAQKLLHVSKYAPITQTTGNPLHVHICMQQSRAVTQGFNAHSNSNNALQYNSLRDFCGMVWCWYTN